MLFSRSAYRNGFCPKPIRQQHLSPLAHGFPYERPPAKTKYRGGMLTLLQMIKREVETVELLELDLFSNNQREYRRYKEPIDHTKLILYCMN
jgi:hypothetical protein